MMRFDPDPAGAGPADKDSPLQALNRAIAGIAPSGMAPVRGVAPAGHRLGALSERYESGGRGPGTVSSGVRDPGGVSYGLYQLASRTGTAAAFVAAEGVRWSRDFIGRAPGTPAFSAAWKAIAAREPEAFAAAQHAFIERTHYRPVVQAVLAQTGLDLDARAAAVRDACWSCAVQHGGAARVLGRAVARADRRASRTDRAYDRALVEEIYAERCDYVSKLAERADPGARRTMRDIVAKRYPAELAAALAMLTTA